LGRTGRIIGGQDSGKLRCAARQAPQALLQVWRVKFECAMARDEVNAMTEGRYRLIGSTASPYAIKLRALLRYRRIPFDWVIMTKALRKATEHLRPNLIPVLQYPDGTYRGETTALAYDLESRHKERPVIPDDKAVAFICDLLEDLADEWAVKPLFLYRWWDPEDQAYVSRWAGEEWSVSEAETGSAEEIEQFRQRQISRMVILGATAENKPLLEESYLRILAAFEPHVGMSNYLFGSRPSLADFAWFGQLSEMATDPTPMRIMRAKAPFTDHWVRRLDDASGVEGEWYPREQALGGMVEALLRIAGELYLPFLVANAEAFAKGLERLEMNVWGLPYALAPFKYQVKCLQQLRDKFSALDENNRAALRPVLERTGCWRHLAGG
jgi:glutathione S-transferase